MRKQSLGQQFQSLITEFKDAGIMNAPEMAGTDIKELRKESKKRKQFVIALRDKLVSAIENETIPRIEISDNDDCQWLLKANGDQFARFQKLWHEEMILFFLKEGLKVNMTEADDGAGLRAWVVITLAMSEPATRGAVRNGG